MECDTSGNRLTVVTLDNLRVTPPMSTATVLYANQNCFLIYNVYKVYFYVPAPGQ